MTDTKLEPKTVGMKMETDRCSHWHWTPYSPAMGPLFFPGWFSSASLPFPSSSVIFYLFSHHKINFFHIFWSGRIGRVLPSPILLFLTIPSSPPLIFVFMNIFIWTELRKTKLTSLFSHFPHLVSPNPTELKLGTPPTPQNTCILFEICAAVTDTVFNCTYRCLLGIFTVNFI